MSVGEQQRVRFRVLEWNPEKKTGVISDQQNYRWDITEANLASECDGKLDVGCIVSGGIFDWETVGDILIESGPNAISDRKSFESVGPFSEAAGSWEPRTGNPNYCPEATPDTADPRTRSRK